MFFSTEKQIKIVEKYSNIESVKNFIDIGADSDLKIAVIPKGTTHEFWKMGEAGAKKAGEELGIEIIWKGPQKESDRAGQIKVVENFITQGVNGIALAPLDDKALVRPVV